MFVPHFLRFSRPAVLPKEAVRNGGTDQAARRSLFQEYYTRCRPDCKVFFPLPFKRFSGRPGGAQLRFLPDFLSGPVRKSSLMLTFSAIDSIMMPEPV
jgi:hypothetical protein